VACLKPNLSKSAAEMNTLSFKQEKVKSTRGEKMNLDSVECREIRLKRG
jgi:hypothetical protein